jgi:hypothetical protein
MLFKREKIKDLFHTCDVDRDGRLTTLEFTNFARNPYVNGQLSKLLHNHAEVMLDVAATAGAARTREEVASAFSGYVTATFGADEAQFNAVSSMLLNWSTPVEFTSDVLGQLCCSDWSHGRKHSVLESLVSAMARANPNRFAAAVAQLIDGEWWGQAGLDPDLQHVCVGKLTQLSQAAVRDESTAMVMLDLFGGDTGHGESFWQPEHLDTGASTLQVSVDGEANLMMQFIGHAAILPAVIPRARVRSPRRGPQVLQWASPESLALSQVVAQSAADAAQRQQALGHHRASSAVHLPAFVDSLQDLLATLQAISSPEALRALDDTVYDFAVTLILEADNRARRGKGHGGKTHRRQWRRAAAEIQRTKSFLAASLHRSINHLNQTQLVPLDDISFKLRSTFHRVGAITPGALKQLRLVRVKAQHIADSIRSLSNALDDTCKPLLVTSELRWARVWQTYSGLSLALLLLFAAFASWAGLPDHGALPSSQRVANFWAAALLVETATLLFFFGALAVTMTSLCAKVFGTWCSDTSGLRSTEQCRSMLEAIQQWLPSFAVRADQACRRLPVCQIIEGEFMGALSSTLQSSLCTCGISYFVLIHSAASNERIRCIIAGARSQPRAMKCS